MSDKDSLFRQQALAHAGDPEALDILPLLPRRIDWIALVMLAVIAVAMVAWSLLGTVTRTVSGNGILIAQGGQVVDAQSTGPGQIAALAVHAGSKVEAGTLIATVIAPDREQRLIGAHALVDARRQSLQRVNDTIERLNQQRTAAADLQREALQSKLAVAHEQISTRRPLSSTSRTTCFTGV